MLEEANSTRKETSCNSLNNKPFGILRLNKFYLLFIKKNLPTRESAKKTKICHPSRPIPEEANSTPKETSCDPSNNTPLGILGSNKMALVLYKLYGKGSSKENQNMSPKGENQSLPIPEFVK